MMCSDHNVWNCLRCVQFEPDYALAIHQKEQERLLQEHRAALDRQGRYEQERNRCQCGKPGRYRMEEAQGKRCADCQVAYLQAQVTERCQWLGEVIDAVLPETAGQARWFHEMGPEAITKAKELHESVRAIGNLQSPEALRQQLLANHEFRIDVKYIKSPKVGESGPGLAARYPDATPAAKPQQEPITCDLGADWDD